MKSKLLKMASRVCKPRLASPMLKRNLLIHLYNSPACVRVICSAQLCLRGCQLFKQKKLRCW